MNAGIENFGAALKANGVEHENHIYPGTNQGFRNNSKPRYSETAAKLAWERTTAFFASKLSGSRGQSVRAVSEGRDNAPRPRHRP